MLSSLKNSLGQRLGNDAPDLKKLKEAVVSLEDVVRDLVKDLKATREEGAALRAEVGKLRAEVAELKKGGAGGTGSDPSGAPPAAGKVGSGTTFAAVDEEEIRLVASRVTVAYSEEKREEDEGEEVAPLPEIAGGNVSTAYVDMVAKAMIPAETLAPVSNAPETSAPVSNAPETLAPVSNAPETSAPVSNAPVSASAVSNAPVSPPAVSNAHVSPPIDTSAAVSGTTGDAPDLSDALQRALAGGRLIHADTGSTDMAAYIARAKANGRDLRSLRGGEGRNIAEDGTAFWGPVDNESSRAKAAGLLLTIDQVECIACGTCVEQTDKVFLLPDGDKATPIAQDGPMDLIQDAIDECPVTCIRWTSEEEVETRGLATGA